MMTVSSTATHSNEPRRNLTLREAAELFPYLSMRQLQRAVYEGRLPATKYGKLYRVSAAEVERALIKRTGPVSH